MFGLADNWRRGETRLKKLAERLDAAAAADEAVQAEFERMARLRLTGAEELHLVCARFGVEIGRLLRYTTLVVDPGEFQADRFRENGPNLIQLHASGRVVQIEYHSPPQPISTEEFRDPYILQGVVRSFNQELLDRNTVEEHQIFYCLGRNVSEWRFFDARTYRSGRCDQNYLTSLLERLL